MLRAANLRAGPGTEYPVTGGARADATFAVQARNPEGTWWQVALAPGRLAWIWGGLVEASQPARELAETELKARVFLDAVARL